MKKQYKILTLSLVLIVIFSLSILTTQIYSTRQENDEEITKKQEPTKINNPKSSEYWPNCPRIHIYKDNWSETDLDWIQDHTGTKVDPHIIENVTINGESSGIGIFIENSTDYFIIRFCTIFNAENGIKLENTKYGTLIKNNCSNNMDKGIYLHDTCWNNTIVENIANNNEGIVENKGYGILLETNCKKNIISGNTANSNDRGIVLHGSCSNNKIINNTANHNEGTLIDQGFGIAIVVGSSKNIISGNNVNDNHAYGIELNVHCHENTISENNASNNGHAGIRLNNGCNDNTISGNMVYNNSFFGILLENPLEICHDNTISGNIVANNSQTGIYLKRWCLYNKISKNLIRYNKGFGIDLGMDNEDNRLYYNSFIGNKIHAHDSGADNDWYKSGIGNHWDNHTSPDLNNDGIVDNPYTRITGTANSQDNFPLTESPVHIGGKIHIDDTGVSAWNWSRTAKLKLWCSGKGKYSDPYIVDNLEINGGGTGNGILIGNSSEYFIISSCKIYNANNGIRLENTGNGTLTKNKCSQNKLIGINLEDNCCHNNISGNEVKDNLYNGIHIQDECDDNIVSGNIVKHNDNGIQIVDDCTNNTVLGNTISENLYNGIYLDNACLNNTIHQNTIKDNTIGLSFTFNSDGNTVYLNNFTNNGLHAQDNCLYNRWDYKFIGNYWDNHTGPDNDKNCIVDIPYTWIAGSAGSQDNFPLMPCWSPSLPSGSAGGGGDGDDDEEDTELDVLTITLLSVGIASAIGIVAVAIFLIRKRMEIENR